MASVWGGKAWYADRSGNNGLGLYLTENTVRLHYEHQFNAVWGT